MFKMELDLIIDILKLVVPTVIALVSLAYAIKQRSLVKREISKKGYLESALSNLNEAIEFLRIIPNLFSTKSEDEWSEIEMIVWDILKGSFNLKKRKFALEVSYCIVDFMEKSDSPSEKYKYIRSFNGIEPRWLFDLLMKKDGLVFITAEPHIVGLSQSHISSVVFSMFEHAVHNLVKASKILSSHEEVYETVAPDSVKKVNHLIEEAAGEVFETIRKPIRLEIDLDKFSKSDDIVIYLFEKVLNCSHIADKFSKVSELISELTEARKELFLKIS